MQRALVALGVVVALLAMGMVWLNLTGRTERPTVVTAPTEDPSVIGSQLCGPWALQRLAELHGMNTSVAQIAEWAGTDEEGTTMLGLAVAAHEMGFLAQGWEARPIDLVRMEESAIAHFTDQHFVVLESASEDEVRYWDALDQQTHTVTLSAFTDRWSGYLLTAAPPPGQISREEDPTAEVE